MIYCECIIKDESKIAKELNEYYIDIAEKNVGIKPVKLRGSEILNVNEKTVNDMLNLKKSIQVF